jgi:1-pyrroline-5-carboxylate dehydrogenase
MNNSLFQLPEIKNEPVKRYAPGSPERRQLREELARQLQTVPDIPLIIGGKEIRTGDQKKVVSPHDHAKQLAVFSNAGRQEVDMAVKAALDAKKQWENTPWQDRAAIFLKAADLISQKYTYLLNAATMLGQSKTPFQAEIDATCELADFFRFNAGYMAEIYAGQPASEKGIWKGLCLPSPRSTSRPLPAICAGPRPSWATPWCGSRHPRLFCPGITSCRSLRKRACLTG